MVLRIRTLDIVIFTSVFRSLQIEQDQISQFVTVLHNTT